MDQSEVLAKKTDLLNCEIPWSFCFIFQNYQTISSKVFTYPSSTKLGTPWKIQYHNIVATICNEVHSIPLQLPQTMVSWCFFDSNSLNTEEEMKSEFASRLLEQWMPSFGQYFSSYFVLEKHKCSIKPSFFSQKFWGYLQLILTGFPFRKMSYCT